MKESNETEYYSIEKSIEHKGINFKRGDYISRNNRHNGWELFRKKNYHIGSINPINGCICKPGEPDRCLKIDSDKNSWPKGVVANDDEVENIACCRGMYMDLIDGEAVFNCTFKAFYIHFSSHWQTLWYCPYCGTQLPNLRCVDDTGTDVYANTLEEVLGKEFCDITEDEIPEEFKTDEWWKKRGL